MRIGLAAATASFQDVPDTHPYFQYIEAMKAKGITSGCSVDPPKFCPEDYATRGQVAAFIMRAMGTGAASSTTNSTTNSTADANGGGMTLFGKQVSPAMAAGGALVLAALLLRR